ncbi:3-((Z)-2-isocyanoethenyl)-1H-indole synthase [Octopus bimaculoides]|uniref:TauD/TfdA-like domain-containing protein n=1 Tax=Octopus bimaculoides TaxID=37653 RepID=A0A0L8GQI7_OCTBM|nr:3-((Z)-2-isocyanoethenyl)-1H-indole synthase [Octopus bimaculoides]XP_014779076.1 3-((Z)-2-isocyanoethenyl)-1H-indole synthase [Octopus bimaculoides]|eukprot:XP_014779075.1 PREDICTED: alpha-ketoglutarate-dependent sulfate ester dioxygenase-like [Octopus bimaculoides]
MSTARKMAKSLYGLHRRMIGAEVTGVKLAEQVSEEVIEQLKKDVHVHKLLLFRNQGVISGERHVEISRWFGELESTFYKHPKSPHPDVFRVSNDERQGCRNVGRTGWHIDGSFMQQPFKFSFYYIASAPMAGGTAFVSLHDVIENLSKEKRESWEKLWMVSDRRSKLIHPLIYPHPVTKSPTMCFHLGMTEGFCWNYERDNEKWTSWEETQNILEDIHEEIVKDNRRLIYVHEWQNGDFILSDNLAVGHEATPETQFAVSEVGLRILHRTTIKGENTPTKA